MCDYTKGFPPSLFNLVKSRVQRITLSEGIIALLLAAKVITIVTAVHLLMLCIYFLAMKLLLKVVGIDISRWKMHMHTYILNLHVYWRSKNKYNICKGACNKLPLQMFTFQAISYKPISKLFVRQGLEINHMK